MAIIVDTNCFARVFNRGCKEHAEFAPVLNWVVNGNGFLVYGGSKYLGELKKSYVYMKFFRLLRDLNKAFEFDRELIDKLTAEYEKKYGNKDFDDPHLPAIVTVSKCRLICSDDKRSIPYVTASYMYPKRFAVPSYYTGAKDSHLLVDRNIDRRLSKRKNLLSKKEKEIINKFIDSIKG